MNYELQLHVTEVFLIAASILTVALAEARNEKLKTGLSLAGVVLGLVWIVSLLDATSVEHGLATLALRLIPILATSGWSISLFVHGGNWLKGRNEAPAEQGA